MFIAIDFDGKPYVDWETAGKMLESLSILTPINQ